MQGLITYYMQPGMLSAGLLQDLKCFPLHAGNLVRLQHIEIFATL